MTNEKALDELNVIYERLSHPENCEQGVYSFRDGDYLEALDMAMQALEQQPSEPRTNLAETSRDCISRQAVIDYAKDTCLDLDKYEDTEVFCDEIKAMPSVTPERPKGKWIGKYISGATDYEVLIKQWQIAKCNKCGKEYKTPYTDCKFVDYAYCPYCGSYNGGREDENNTGR